MRCTRVSMKSQSLWNDVECKESNINSNIYIMRIVKKLLIG